MRKYRIEMHAHTKTSSCDSELTAEELILGLKDKGYDGVVITNHLDKQDLLKYVIDEDNDNILDTCCGDCDICDGKHKIETSSVIVTPELLARGFDKWLDGIREAKTFGLIHNFKVYTGAELSIPGEIHLSLLGITVSDLQRSNIVANYNGIDSIRHLMSDVLILHNHPKRMNCRVLGYDEVDGYEIINTKKEKSSSNVSGYIELMNDGPIPRTMVLVKGGDVHGYNNISENGGLLFDTLPINEKELVRLLKAKKFEISKP